MASHGDSITRAFTISEDLSSKRYFLMKAGASDHAVLVNDSKGGIVLGTLDEAANGSSDTKHVRVVCGGFGKVSAGGSVSYGNYLISDASGEAIASDGAGQHVFGIALQAGDDGDIIEYQSVHLETNA